jgi:hypothetical protein
MQDISCSRHKRQWTSAQHKQLIRCSQKHHRNRRLKPRCRKNPPPPRVKHGWAYLFSANTLLLPRSPAPLAEHTQYAENNFLIFILFLADKTHTPGQQAVSSQTLQIQHSGFLVFLLLCQSLLSCLFLSIKASSRPHITALIARHKTQ